MNPFFALFIGLLIAWAAFTIGWWRGYNDGYHDGRNSTKRPWPK